MAETTFRLQIVTPERVIFDGRVSSLQLPGAEGLIGILPNHAPLVTALNPGPVTIKDEQGKPRYIMVSDGFFEMANNSAKLLADAGESADEIDPARAEAAEKRARERLRAAGKQGSDLEFALAERALQRALWRLKLAKRGGR